VVIHDLDFVGVAVAPGKAQAPLVIDADTVLALTIALQALQPVSRQQREGSHVRSRVQHVQFPQRLTLNDLEPAHGFPAEKALRISAAESPDHLQNVYCYSVNVKQYSECATRQGRAKPNPQAALVLLVRKYPDTLERLEKVAAG